MKTFTEFIQSEEILIDTDVFNLIYDIIVNKSWTYITKELVIGWLGHNDKDSIVSNFYRKHMIKYEINIDYKEVDKDHELIKKYYLETGKRFPNNAKFYIISGKTLITMVMKSKKLNSLRIMEHFYYIYDLVFKYHEYQSIQLKLDYENEIEKIRNMEHNRIYTAEQVLKYKEVENNYGYVYFIYEENEFNFFKIGFTCDLDARLRQLQCGNRRILNIYKYIECDDPYKLEQSLHKKYNNRRIYNEWFEITKDEIDKYITKFNKIDKCDKLNLLTDDMKCIKLQDKELILK